MHNVEFADSEYDLSTIANAVQIDGLLNRSVNIFVEQINKNGYEFVVPNDKLQTHVTNRIREIELFTNIKHTQLIFPNLFVAKKLEAFTKSIFSMGEFVILNKIFKILSV